MGQYYKMVVLNTHKKNAKNCDKIKVYMESWSFDQGAKLMEFSWMGNKFVEHLESLINLENGPFAHCPIIVAGDYADAEPNKYNNEKVNIYDLTIDFGKELTPDWFEKHNIKPQHYRYLINETKGVFFDTERVKHCDVSEYEGKKYFWKVHPLPILCCDGNGRGGGDLHSRKNMRAIGSWRRNVVVTSNNRPDESVYREVFYNFTDKF